MLLIEDVARRGDRAVRTVWQPLNNIICPSARILADGTLTRSEEEAGGRRVIVTAALAMGDIPNFGPTHDQHLMRGRSRKITDCFPLLDSHG